MELSSLVHEDSTFEVNHHVQQAVADYRDKLIADVTYQVDLSLPKGDWYGGKVTVNFELLDKPTQELFIDFRGIKIGHY
jgi:hypothetical protein